MVGVVDLFSLSQNRDALDSVLMLVQSRDQVTSELARRLMRKVGCLANISLG